MGFTVKDLRDLIRIIDEHPEWKREIRRVVLADDLLELPSLVRELAEAQRATEERIEALAEAQRRTEARVEELAEAQRRTEARLEALAQRVDELAEAQRRTEERLAALTARVDRLAEVQERLVNDVADLKGDNLERKFRERVRQFVRKPYRGARLLTQEELGDELDAAVDEGRITEEEADEVLRADAVVSARDGEGDLLLVVEVSSVVDRHDVERAVRRAAIIRKLGKRSEAAVAGQKVTQGANQEAVSAGVVLLGM